MTGGSGYLGACILKRAPKDWQIAATYFAHALASENVAAFRVDVRDPDAVDRLFDEFHPDVVIHTAAQMDGDTMMSTNVEGSHNVAHATANARLIHLSTDVIFDGEHAPYDETALPSPISPYGESKARAEQTAIELHPRAAVVRTSLIYGFSPPDPRTWQTLNGEMPRLFTDEYRCPIFVDDLADALLELAQNDFVGILNVAGPQRLSRYEFGLKIAKAFRLAPRFEPALSASHPVRRPRDCTLDISLAQNILHTRLRGIDQVLSEI